MGVRARARACACAFVPLFLGLAVLARRQLALRHSLVRLLVVFVILRYGPGVGPTNLKLSEVLKLVCHSVHIQIQQLVNF